MTYWLVRSKWGSVDKTKLFVDKKYWENGYDNKYSNIVNRIKKDDILLLADGSYIRYFAYCTENKNNGKTVNVDKWILFEKAIFFHAKGAYIRTIVSIKNKTLLNKIQVEIEALIKDLYISSVDINNFMSLKNGEIKFSKGINLFIGENGSGKSQLLKLLYSVIDSNNNIKANQESDYENKRTFAKNLVEIFQTKQLGNLVNKDEKKSTVTINLDAYKLSFSFQSRSTKEVSLANSEKYFINKKTIFIPAKEVLSFFDGFRILYETKYLSFDKTYYNLCKALEEPPSKVTSLGDIIDKLEFILDGKIKIINGSFYLIKNDREYEISLVAEGLRKIGMLSYLLSNETLDNQSILFWDEPEANMHPKLIDDIVSFLVMLTNKGMQIFISTHSPYIIESFNNHLKKDKIKNMRIEDNEIISLEALNPKKMKAYLLEYNNITSILDESLGLLDDKLLNNFNDINHLYDKMRDIEWNDNDNKFRK